ncbi:MAG: GIY-YIG nuclease family protein [Oceanicaulis sp.]
MDCAYIYILTNKPYGVLYLGMSNENLCRRIYDHRNGITRGFTWKYNCHRLVWYEPMPDVGQAAEQEHRMKRWRRAWKIALIEKTNPDWRDLYEKTCGPEVFIPPKG